MGAGIPNVEQSGYSWSSYWTNSMQENHYIITLGRQCWCTITPRWWPKIMVAMITSKRYIILLILNFQNIRIFVTVIKYAEPDCHKIQKL